MSWEGWPPSKIEGSESGSYQHKTEWNFPLSIAKMISPDSMFGFIWPTGFPKESRNEWDPSVAEAFGSGRP